MKNQQEQNLCWLRVDCAEHHFLYFENLTSGWQANKTVHASEILLQSQTFHRHDKIIPILLLSFPKTCPLLSVTPPYNIIICIPAKHGLPERERSW